LERRCHATSGRGILARVRVLIVGVLIRMFAPKLHALAAGIAFGLAVGAHFALAAAIGTNRVTRKIHLLEITIAVSRETLLGG